MAFPFELHREAKRGNTARVYQLLRDGSEINATDRAGYTPLMYALESPAAPVELVRLLLDRGGTVADVGLGGAQNIASVCLRGGDPLKLATVLDHGVDLHYSHSAGYDALMDAAFSRNAERDPGLLDVLKTLIARGVALNNISIYRESALRVLAARGRFDAVQLLLDAGADETQLAWSPLHRAVALGTLADVKALVKDETSLESIDWWESTPWLLAVKSGDVEKARYLAECGADLTVTGKGDASPLDLAIESFHTPMIEWLIELRISVESSPDCCNTPLMNAVEAGNTEAVDLLIAAAADIDRKTGCGTALGRVRSSEIALRLLDAGADPANLSFEGRRAILGLEPEPDAMLFEATLEDFYAAPTARWGDHNPERMDQPFWQAMIRSGVTASAAAQLVGETCGTGPVWCAQRFGQSLTLLPDGRAIQIGGEHEDHYDPDFCIYNDVFVHHPDGRIDIYCYPEDAFGPTDFHTANLIDDSIYVIGGLGYPGSRRFGETPVFRVDTDTLQIFRVECTGEPPGWISEHRAVPASPHEVRVWGGRISAEAGNTENYEKNHCTFVLDVSRRHWRREP